MRLSLCLDPGRPWGELSGLGQLADDGSWHAVYVCDHFMPHDEGDRPVPGPMLECWTTLSALSALTARVRLGPLVLGNTYRHPAVVANMAATLDRVSGGRVVLGLGAGWQRNEHDAYGIPLPPPGPRVEAFDESCRVIRALLDEESVTFDGRHYRLADARCEPKPLQQRLPLLVGGSGPRMLDVAARRADVWHAWLDAAGLRGRNAVLEERCAAIGRDPAALRRATGGTVDVRTRGERPSQGAPADVAGTVEQVLDELLGYAAAGADEFIVVDDASSTSYDQSRDLLCLLDEELSPAVRRAGGTVNR